jgi:cytidylate kinase
MKRRDRIDSQREVSPLKVAGDAVVIDTTRMTVTEVVERLRALVQEGVCPRA